MFRYEKDAPEGGLCIIWKGVRGNLTALDVDGVDFGVLEKCPGREKVSGTTKVEKSTVAGESKTTDKTTKVGRSTVAGESKTITKTTKLGKPTETGDSENTSKTTKLGKSTVASESEKTTQTAKVLE